MLKLLLSIVLLLLRVKELIRGIILIVIEIHYSREAFSLLKEFFRG